MRNVLAIVLAVLVLPAAASAHRGAPYWSATYAENELVKGDIEWASGSFLEVNDATCRGYGRYIRAGRTFKFQHFRCYVEGEESDAECDPEWDECYPELFEDYVDFHTGWGGSYRVWGP